MKTRYTPRARDIFTRGYCPYCGKHCYPSRKIARKAGKVMYPGLHMGTYACGPWFHITSEPQRKKEARRQVRERDESFLEESLNEMYEKAEREDAVPWHDPEEPMLLTPGEVEQLERALGETFPEEPE